MSEYRFSIVKHDDIDCLHVMIAPGNDLKEIAATYIPLDDIQAAVKRYEAECRRNDIATRRSEGAKSGWEIRRAKQKRKVQQ